ncbi:MAG TPA: ribosome biogenesis GTPase Der [Candidatus Limnocylindrales bacterium]
MAAKSAGLPVVAFVGRPNVGKSTLFNRVVGNDRAAIVEDRARTTRDRLYGHAEWNGRRFVVVDTGGLEVSPGDPIEEQVQIQARLAINEADVIVFLVDAATGPTPADLDAAEMLRRATKPVLVAANKADNLRREMDATEFFAFGWEDTFAISASHGRGVADLLDAVVWAMPPESEQEIARKAREDEAEAWAKEMARAKPTPYVVGDPANAADDEADEEGGDGEGAGDAPGSVEDVSARWDAAMAADNDEPPAIAFVGRPNVGKSSLLNSLLGDNRMIVSEIPGTTRDAIDTTIPWGRSEVVLIDTAGIKKRGRVANGPAAEKYSTMRALKAISRADVAVLVLDAHDGLTAQDAHVAGYVIEEGRGLVIAVNKWDIVEDKTHKSFDEFVAKLRRELPFIDYAPIVSISALTGQRVRRVLELAVDVWGERRKRVGTGELNRLVSAAVERNPPAIVHGKRAKIRYATQAGVAPPTFVLFATDPDSIHFSYRRYLENRIREAYGFDGTPIRLVFREQVREKRPKGRSSRTRKG